MSKVCEVVEIYIRIPLGVPSCVIIAPYAEESDAVPRIVILVKFLIFPLKLVTVYIIRYGMVMVSFFTIVPPIW